MARAKEHYGRHVVLTEDLLTDPKWQKLSRSAILVWIMLRREYKGTVSTELSLCQSQIKDLISYRSFWRGIKELESIGWVEIISHGGLPKIPNKYKLRGPHGYFIYKGRRLW